MIRSSIFKAFTISLCLSVSLYAFHASSEYGSGDTLDGLSNMNFGGNLVGDVSAPMGSSGFLSGPISGTTPMAPSNLPWGDSLGGMGSDLTGFDSAAGTNPAITDMNQVQPETDCGDRKDKASPCEIDQTPTQSCENNMNSEQGQIGNENGMDSMFLMMLMSLFDKDSSSSSSSDSSSSSGYTIVRVEKPIINYNGNGSNKGDDDSSDDDDSDDDSKGSSGGDPSDLTDYGNIKNKFPSAIEETKTAAGSTNTEERVILTSVPQTPSRMNELRRQALSNPTKAARLAEQRLVNDLSSTGSSQTTQRDRQVMRIATLAEGFGIGVATLAAVNSMNNNQLAGAPQSAQEAAKQNGISKIKRAVPYTLMANAKAATGRARAMGDLDAAANYAGTGSKGTISPDNQGECPVCPPPGECEVCKTTN